MEHVGLFPVLLLSLVLFAIGTVGVLVRRNVLIVLMSIELMVNGVNVAFVGFARESGDMGGHVLVLFAMAVAAAEVAVGLALVILLFRSRVTANLDDLDLLKG